jgi:hypothetical protein
VGDFNEILDNTETCEGGRRALRLMEDFKNTLVACELFELKATGHKYTWHNGRDEQDFIQEKLDRVTGTSEWCLLFPSAHVQIDEALSSDHNPVSIRVQGMPCSRRKRTFFYEAKWGLEKDCKNIIKQVWKEKHCHSDKWRNLKGKLDRCKTDLSRWNKGRNENVEQEIASKSKILADLQENEESTAREQIQQLQREVHLLLEKEDLFWRQRSREAWLKDGDRNTKFFHASVNQKRRNGLIHEIADLDGVEWKMVC